MQVTLLSLAVSGALHAQADDTATSQVKELSPMVVTATRSAKSIAEIAGNHALKVERRIAAFLDWAGTPAPVPMRWPTGVYSAA